MRKRKLLLLIMLSPLFAIGQISAPDISFSAGKGLTFEAKDKTAKLKLGVRIQPLLVVNYRDFENFTDPSLNEVQMLIRRARLKFDGYVFNSKWVYKLELALGNRNLGGTGEHTSNGARLILDAVIKYEFAKNSYVWFGQAKLPGNRERVVSSGKLQFVDRSIANGRFNIDRDMGFQYHGNYKAGGNPLNVALAISMGEGRNITDFNSGGLEYTGRLEYLPFGAFTNKGDYFLSDLEREQSHKLSVGITGDYNHNAVRQRGNQGNYMITDQGELYTQSLSSIQVDALWKYNGWSALGEFFYRTSPNPFVPDSLGNNTSDAFYVGNGSNFQMGYLFKSNWEMAGRFSHVNPEDGVDLEFGDQTQYTFVVSKFLNGHALKIQSDITYSVYELIADPEWQFRFQIELAL